jgi:hypothetical protein
MELGGNRSGVRIIHAQGRVPNTIPTSAIDRSHDRDGRNRASAIVTSTATGISRAT